MLYQKYSVPVFNTICRLVNFQVAEAEDLLQETFVSVFSKMERLKEIESFEAWTKRVAINLSISHLRKRRVYFQELDDTAHLDIADDDDDSIRWRESRLDEIEQAIASLPETSKTIVNLFVFEDIAQEEIGKLLGMSHAAVRSQYHRAKNRIAAQLKKELSNEEER